MANVIDILINAKDQASATIKKVGDTLNKNQESFKNMAVAGGIAFGALSGVIMKSVASAQESQQVHAQLEAVLKSTGGAVGLTIEAIEAQSSALQKSLGISDEVIASGQNMLLTFTNIGKDIFPKATETMLDMATAMNGGAIPSADQLKGTSIQLGKALNDPIKGISALSKVGVTFTDEQKNMIEGMVKMGDTAGAQKLILAELNREFGGSALAQSKTFEGSMRKLSVTFGDIFENIGMALIPALQKVADYITPIVQKVTDWAGANPQLVTAIVAVGAVLSGLLLAVGTFGALLPAIAGGVSALAGVFGILLGPVGLVIAGVVALGVAWSTNFLGIRDITASVWEAIVGAFNAGVDWIMKTIEPFLEELRKFWSENGTQIIEGLKMFWEGAKIIFTQMFEWIKLYVGTAWDIISGIFSVAFTLIKANFEIFFTILSGILTAGMQILNGDWSGAWETVKGTFSRVGETIVKTGEEVFEKLNSTVTSIVDRIENYVSGSLTRIKDTLKEIVTLGRANTTTFNGAPAVEIAGARAKGGPVMNGDAYLVGENGPEIFTPSRSGTIIPNDKVGGGGNVFNFGGITINNKNDADYFLDGLARKMQLGKIGIS